MSTQLKASLQLTLQDQLSAGLEKLQKQLEGLRDLAKTLGLGELDDALEQLRGGAGNVDKLNENLQATERAADRATSALRRMSGAANDNAIGVGSDGVASLHRSLGSLVVLPGGLGAGGGGGGGGGRDVSFADPAEQLRLAGPAGAGGIPINLGSSPPKPWTTWTRNMRAEAYAINTAARHFSDTASEGINKGLGAAIEGFAVYEPIKKYAEYENTLRHIGITEKLSGDQLEAEIKRLNALFGADALKTGQSSESIAKAYSDLVQTGIPARVLDTAIKAHSEAATAYNISPEAMGPAVGALLQNMKIPEGDLGAALSAMASASKEGRFKVEDFSRQLPGTTGYLSLLGMTGRKSADIGFAGLETVMKNAAEPNQAAADFNDALHYITSPIARRSFAHAGIDLPGLLENAQKKGINPLDAVLGKLDAKTRGMDPIAAAEYLGKLLHNQQAGMAILSLLQHKDEFLKLRDALDHVGKGVLDADFINAFRDPITQVRLLNEQTSQLVRILGEGFSPVLVILNLGLLRLVRGLTWMNTNMPGTLHVILGAVGGLLALGAALGIVGVVFPAIAAGWGVVSAVFTALLGPLGAILIALTLLGAAAWDIYSNWGSFAPFFQEMWAGVKEAFSGFIDFFAGMFTGDFGRAWNGIKEIAGGFGTFWAAEWEIAKQLFNDFATWVDGWSGGLASRILAGIASGWHVLADGFSGLIKQLEDRLTNGWLGRHLGLSDLPQISQPAPTAAGTAGAAGAQSGRSDQLHVTVEAKPGTGISEVTASNPNHTVTASSGPNRGSTLRRP